jgi:hypothetical protein
MVGFPSANGKHIVTIERDMGNAVPTNDQDFINLKIIYLL